MDTLSVYMDIPVENPQTIKTRTTTNVHTLGKDY